MKIYLFLVINLIWSASSWPFLASEVDRHSQLTYSNNNQFKILTLYAGQPKETGLDFKLAKQVLKLALERAQQLYPHLNISMDVRWDTSECNYLNSVAYQLVNEYYSNRPDRNSRRNSIDQLVIFPGQHGTNASSAIGLNHHSPIANGNGPFNSTMRSAKKKKEDKRSDIISPGSFTAMNRFKRFSLRENDEKITKLLDGGVYSDGRFGAIVGPTCDFSLDIIARMASYWQKPIYSSGAIGSAFSKKDIYTTLTRLTLPTGNYTAHYDDLSRYFSAQLHLNHHVML